MATDAGWGNLGNTAFVERAVWASAVELAIRDLVTFKRLSSGRRVLSQHQSAAINFVFGGNGVFDDILLMMRADTDRARARLVQNPLVAEAMARWRAAADISPDRRH